MDFIKNLAVNWTAGNPVLPDEVFGIEIDTNRVKLGDGATRWNSLSYFGEGGSATWGSITGTLASQTDLNTEFGTKVDANTTITGATKTKITYDAKGLVTSGADATQDDIGNGSTYVRTHNDFTDAKNTALGVVTLPAVGTLTTGSNAIDLTNAYGKEYHPYDMASGALTLTVAASPVRGGNAYGIIIADGATTPTTSAFTTLSGSYTNTDNVENHFLITYKYNGSDVLTAYLQWVQPS